MALYSQRKCPACGITKQLTEFPEHESLPDGRGPWCIACMKELNELPTDSPRKGSWMVRYRRDYQKLYHSGYNKKPSSKRLKIKNGNGNENGLLFENVYQLREPKILKLVASMLPSLMRTQRWVQFDAELITAAKVSHNSWCSVKRILPPELYPEFCLVEGNCYVSCQEQGTTHEELPAVVLQDGDTEIGIMRLRECMQEIKNNAR